MRFVLARTAWGLADEPSAWPAFLDAMAAEGADCVALPVQRVDAGAAAALRDRAGAAGVGVVAQVFTFGRTIEDHLASLRDGLATAATVRARHVVLQGGRDGWDVGDVVRFARSARDAASDAGLLVLHETHRGRMLFNPWVTRRVLEDVDDLWLAADLSHWACVTESLRIQPAIVEAVARVTRHIDARVGWEEGPQVADPRVEGARPHVEAFEAWWDAIWEAQARAGAAELVFMPEFGPPPYQPVHPATGEPLADIAEVNRWMAERLRARYDATDGRSS